MFEIIDNSIQIAVIFGCGFYSVYKTVLTRSRLWLVCSLFMASYFLGDLWWLLNEVLYPGYSEYSLVPYINWKASVVFLIMLLQQERKGEKLQKPGNRYMWLIFVFCAVMCAYYMQFGAYVDNVTTAILMAVLIWTAVQRTFESRQDGNYRADDHELCRMALIFCVLEYTMWTSTCLNYGNPLRGLYYICEAILTVFIIMLTMAVRKAVGR